MNSKFEKCLKLVPYTVLIVMWSYFIVDHTMLYNQPVRLFFDEAGYYSRLYRVGFMFGDMALVWWAVKKWRRTQIGG